MEVVIVDSPPAGATLVADVVARLLREKPTAVLGLATGSSVSLIYAELIARVARGEITLASAQAFLLDEYVGLPADHPQRYSTVIAAELTDQVDLPAGAVQGPDGAAPDVPAECRRYEAAIAAAGGIDLQLLGIGRDGHIGFNEPGSSLASRTRLKSLTRATREDNARFFDRPESVPRHVLTQGLATIGAARHVVLVAAGAHKAAPIAAAVEGPVSAFCPASVLQLHPRVTVVVDDAAASDLRLSDYYRETFAAKPTWQRP